jgi:hypothetical protein
MVAARAQLEARKVREALAPEQGALKHLQRAEAAFRDVQVSFEQGGQGGGSMNAEDLADLFELELDKLKNQYETVQRGAEQQADNEVDAALERLRELARRQEQEIERMRQLAGRLPNQGGGGRGSQQQLAEETEELARRLERLAREQSSPAMQDTARRLQDAANAMKRSGRGGQDASLGESAAALERLRDARKRLEKNQAGRVERNIREAQRAVGELARAQEKIAAEAEQQLGQGGVGQQSGRTGRLMERKDELANQVSQLEGQLDRMSQEARGSEKDAARKLQEAADSIRDRKLRDKIRYSKGVLAAGAAEQSRQLEGEIGSDIDALGKKLEQAAGAAAPSDADKRTAALERMRELTRNLESLQGRLQEKSGGRRSSERKPGEESAEGQSSKGQSKDQSAQGESSEGQGSEGEGSEGQSARGETGEGPGGQARGERGGDRQARAGGAQGGPGTGSPDDGLAAGGAPRFTPGDARQVRRELRERLREAEALGRELGAGGPYDLREVVRGMRRFDNEEAFGEPRGLARLVGSVVEDLKSAEFALRREIEGPDREKLFQSGSQDLPPGWQQLVQEYYRSLSKTR